MLAPTAATSAAAGATADASTASNCELHVLSFLSPAASVRVVATWTGGLLTKLLFVILFLQTKSYFLMLDMGRDDLVLEWVRTLLQAIK